MSMMTISVSGSPMHRLSVSRALASAAAAWIVVVPLWAGATTPGYSHIASYISELGALLGIGTSYIGAALARCDPGCPATGSSRQTVHNLLGLLEYGGGGIGWRAARRLGSSRIARRGRGGHRCPGAHGGPGARPAPRTGSARGGSGLVLVAAADRLASRGP